MMVGISFLSQSKNSRTRLSQRPPPVYCTRRPDLQSFFYFPLVLIDIHCRNVCEELIIIIFDGESDHLQMFEQ